MTSQAIALATARGVDLEVSEGHVSRMLTPDLIRSADLILAMTRDHRRTIVEMDPAQLKRVFTTREFARLSNELRDQDLSDMTASHSPQGPPDLRRRFGDVLGLIASQRGLALPPSSENGDDVIDPYRRSIEVYEQCGNELDPGIDAVERMVRFAVGAR